MYPRAAHDGPLITLAVLNRNGEKRLPRVFPSVRAQDYRPREILVLDNGSQDGGVEYLRRFDDVRVVCAGENLGYGRGKNRLVREAAGEYVLLLDNDIELPRADFVSTMYRELASLPDAAFLSPLLVDADKGYVDSDGLYFNRVNRRVELEDIQSRGVKPAPRYVGGACLVRKSVYEALGGIDETYPIHMDDYDLSARAYLRGWAVYRTTTLVVVHHGIERQADLDAYCWRNRYYLCGFGRMIWKNYRLRSAAFWWPVSAGWILARSLKACLAYRSLRPAGAYFRSFGTFLRDLPDTLGQRRRVQSQRVTKEDRFLDVAFFRRAYGP